MKKLIACLALTGVLLASLPLGALAAEPVPPVETAPGTVLLTPEETAPEAPAAPETPAPEVPAAPEEAPAPPEAPAPEAPASPEEPAAPAPQAEEDDSLMYVALGDSIAAGVGLKDVVYLPAQYGYDMTPNFKGYSPDCYVSVVAEGLGLDRDHAINLGLPALMTKDMLEMLQTGSMSGVNVLAGTYYSYPEYQEYVRQADIISIAIGCNDITVPFIVSLGEATNWKSEKLANYIVSGTLRDFTLESFSLFMDAVQELVLTPQEFSDLFQALTTGMYQKCQDGYANTTTYLPQVIAAVRELNPDAQILVIGYYNPVPLLYPVTDHFIKLNRFARELCEQTGATFVPVPLTSTANDAHPTIRGHKYIGNQILKALGAQ